MFRVVVAFSSSFRTCCNHSAALRHLSIKEAELSALSDSDDLAIGLAKLGRPPRTDRMILPDGRNLPTRPALDVVENVVARYSKRDKVRKSMHWAAQDFYFNDESMISHLDNAFHKAMPFVGVKKARSQGNKNKSPVLKPYVMEERDQLRQVAKWFSQSCLKLRDRNGIQNIKKKHLKHQFASYVITTLRDYSKNDVVSKKAEALHKIAADNQRQMFTLSPTEKVLQNSIRNRRSKIRPRR
jgi:ribosomal protein S7